MVRKRSPTNKDMQPPRIDDLKLINGIGPGVEKRLNGVGIFAFAQLAALSPADVAAAVADLTGLSTERIIKQDWIGQARKLAAGEAQTHVEAPAPVELLVAIERAHVTTDVVEPEQAHELTTEVISDAAQEDVEVLAEPVQDASFVTPVEPAASTEHAPLAPSSIESEIDAAPPTQHSHPVTFTVEFLLKENNNVGNTHVLHNQSGRELTWTGWQNTKLVDFMIESAELKVPSDEPTLPVNEESAHSEEPELTSVVASESGTPTPLAEKAGLTGTLHLRDMEILGVDPGSSPRTLIHNKPFDTRLTLDLTELQVPGNTPLNYNASIFGKSSRTGLILGEVQGTITPTDTITIKVEGNTPLEKGTYQLVATVIVGLPTMKLRIRPGTTAVIDGGQIQVL